MTSEFHKVVYNTHAMLHVNTKCSFSILCCKKKQIEMVGLVDSLLYTA